MHNATYISYDAAADYNAKFIKKDANGLDATNQGWCHRFAPFRAFICDPMVIQCLRFFKKTRCNNGYPDFDNSFLKQYFGNDYIQDEWCTACCNFITTLVQNTDRYGRLIQKRGYGCLKRTGNDLNTLGNLTSYTLNKDIYESIGNTLEYKYTTSINEMCCFLSAVLSILISNSVRYEADIENQHLSVKDKSFYEAKNQYKFTRSPIIYYGNHFFNSCRINNQYTLAGYDNKEPYYNTHKDLVKKYINSFWPTDKNGQKIPGQEPLLTMFVPKITARGKEMCDYSHAVPTQAGNQHQHTVLSEKVKISKLPKDTHDYNVNINEIRNNLQQMVISNNNFNLAKMWNNPYLMQQAINNYNSNASCYQSNLQSTKDLVKRNHYLKNLAYRDFWIYPNGAWILK